MPSTSEIIDKAAREAGVDPKDPAFRAKLFKALWAAGIITHKPT